MKQTLFFLSLIFTVTFFSCDPEMAIVDPETNEEETPPVEDTTTVNILDSLLAGSFCFPPLTIDTSTVVIEMQLDETDYFPTANFSCIIPNFFLGIDQIWINGSVPPALKVVSLIMPVDIEEGTYPLQHNSTYSAFYTPSSGNDFLTDSGALTITLHDQENKRIEGTFEFKATNLSSQVLPQVDITDGSFRSTY